MWKIYVIHWRSWCCWLKQGICYNVEYMTWHCLFFEEMKKKWTFSSKVLCFPGWSWMWILRKYLLGLSKAINDREKVRREDLCVPLSKGSVCRYNFTAGNLLLSRGRDCKVGFVRGERMAMIYSYSNNMHDLTEHKAQIMLGVCLSLQYCVMMHLVRHCRNNLSIFTFNYHMLFVNFLFRNVLLFPQVF